MAAPLVFSENRLVGDEGCPMSDEPQRPTSDDDRDAWKAYWMAQGMPWRTEPEIDEERQRYLAQRRDSEADIEIGNRPFKYVELDRGDVEWLLATHVSKGITGPVVWGDKAHAGRIGIDIRAARLVGDFSDLPLACTQAGVSLSTLRTLVTANNVRMSWLEVVGYITFTYGGLILGLLLMFGIYLSGRQVPTISSILSPPLVRLLEVALFAPVTVFYLIYFTVIKRSGATSRLLRGLASLPILIALLLITVSLVLQLRIHVVFADSTYSLPTFPGATFSLLYDLTFGLFALGFLGVAVYPVFGLLLGIDNKVLQEEAQSHAAILSLSHFRNSHFEGAILVGAKCTKCDFVGAYFASASLDYADLGGADLSEAEWATGGRPHGRLWR
jgi:hypothetical protein